MYSYADERPFVFTEEGVNAVIAMRDHARTLLLNQRRITVNDLLSTPRVYVGDSFKRLACVDYLAERGDLVKVGTPSVTQYQELIRGRLPL